MLTASGCVLGLSKLTVNLLLSSSWEFGSYSPNPRFILIAYTNLNQRDTVASVGVLWSPSLPSTNSNSAIKIFRHALSLDEVSDLVLSRPQIRTIY